MSPDQQCSPSGRGETAGYRRRLLRATVAVVAVCLAAVMGIGSAWAYNYTKQDLSWYTNNPQATEFVIGTAGQLQAFSALVNGDAKMGDTSLGAVTFEGKTVKLAGSISLFGNEFTPIGTEAHPFAGTFDGQGAKIDRLVISSPSRTSDVGLFGVTAAGSLIENVALGDRSAVTLSSADKAFEDIGSLVGDCRGSVENCTSAARVTLGHTATNVAGSIMKNIGGVAGKVQGTVTGTSFTGALKAETPANAYTGPDGDSVATVVENVAGVVGWFGNDLSDCTNGGTLLVITSGKSGIDRFGSSVDAKSLYVGGVGGYGLGNVTDCHNTATLFTTSISGATLANINDENARQADGGGDGMGGVVGSLRGIAMSGLGDNRGDPGLEAGAATLIMSDCSNTGYVSGLHCVGGVVGSQGSNTVVTRCTNGVAGSDATSNVGHVRTTRWNKPSGGGVVGQSWGTISYSRNHGQSENTKTGYFSAGICGMMEMHDGQTAKPEIYACYNTGLVYCAGVTASFYEGGIVGENEGYVHDNVFLNGTVSSHLTNHEDADDVAAGRNYGTVANTTVVYETQKQADDNDGISIKSGEAVGILNKLSANNGWTSYYFISDNANNGYPVLNGQATPDSMIDLSKVACTIEYASNAKYTAAYNPVPSLKVTVTVDGATSTLVEGADYKVVADPNALDENGVCKGLTDGKKPYTATIEGIGNYYGTPTAKTAYGIDRGDFSECTVSVVNGTWTGLPQNNPDVTVVDAGGSLVDPADYTVVVNDGNDCIKKNSAYPVKASAKDASNYIGTAVGLYTIEPGDLYKDADVIGITYDNRVWYYDEDECDLYEVIPADAQGNALPEGSDLQYDANGLPYVVPQSYTNPDTGKADTRTTYVSEDGRRLTVAEAKNKDANGNTVYGDMSVDFTGDAVEPSCIGVLYPCDADDYQPTLLKGLPEDKITVDNVASLDYSVQYGRYGDDVQRSAPRNVNATTSSDKPEASMVVYGIMSGNFKNYAYMDFTIDPIQISSENLVAVQKEKNTLPYSSGARPADPQTSSTATGNVNTGVEVRYLPDPEAYDADDPSTYRVLDGANWTLQFDHATDADGGAIGDGQYAAGSKVYYKVVPTAACSVTGWSELKVTEPFIVESNNQINLYNNIIQVEVQEDKEFCIGADGGIVPPDITITNTATGKKLVEGEDYVIRAAGASSRNAEYDEKTGTIKGTVMVDAKGTAYTGGREVDFTLQKADVANGILKVASFQYAEPENSLGATSLVYRAKGWTAEQVSEVLCTMLGGNQSYIDRGCFTVTKIEQNGQAVDRIHDLGAYTLTVEVDNGASHFVTGVQSFTLDVQLKKVNLGKTSSSIGVGLRTFSKIDLTSHEFMYTGNDVIPEVVAFDGAGDPLNLDLPLVWPNGTVEEPGSYNVPSTEEETPGQYSDLRISGDGVYFLKNTNSSKTTGTQYTAIPGIVDLSFDIVAADLADSEKVTIKANDGEDVFFDGAEAKPAVSFYDAQTGEPLNYTPEDYTLSYENCKQVGSAISATPPTVIITPTANGHLTVGGDATASLRVPFTIKGEGDDVSTVAWDYASRIVVKEDGTLSEPGVIGSIAGVPVADDAYQVETGMMEGSAFVRKDAGWSAGDQVSLRVTGIKDGVLTGAAVLGPVEAVASNGANTFTEGSTTLSAQASGTVYTGQVADPTVTAADTGTALVEGRDFKVSCSDVNAGTATATVSGLGAYAGSLDVSFAIAPANMKDIVAETADKPFSGSHITLDASDVTSVSLNGVKLPATDYALKEEGFGANVNVAEGGTATLVPASGNLSGEVQITFAITPAPLVNDELTVAVDESMTYTGTAIGLDGDMLSVRDNVREIDLEFGKDYVIAGYGNNIDVGTATVYLAGAGNYSASDNTVTATFSIVPADFSAAAMEGVKTAYEFAGTNNPIKPVPSMVLHGVTLPASDYVVTYGSNDAIGIGAGSVIVTPRGGNVTGEAKSLSFDIAVDVSKATVEAIPNGTYMPDGSYEPDLYVSFNGVDLELNTHYTVTYDSDVNAGTKTLKITGIEPCTGERSVTYNVDGKSLNGVSVEANLEGLTYTGSALQPEVTLTDGSYELRAGIDYDATYENNVNATNAGSPATITITGKGNYAGVLTRAFDIAPRQLKSDGIAATATAKSLFSGSSVEASVAAHDEGIVIDALTGAAYRLVEGVDYTLTYANNNAVGTAVATLTGKGNYTGTRDAAYAVKGDMSAARISSLAACEYTGMACRPAPTASLVGVPLASGTDYTVSYVDNILPGTATVTLTGMGSYEGTAVTSFTITTPAYFDAATGVTVTGTALKDLAIDGADVQVLVKRLVSDDAVLIAAKGAYATGDTDAFLGFSVTLQTVKNGVTTQVRDGFGQLGVTLPVGDGYNGRTATVIIRHTAEDGTVTFESQRVTVADGAVTVTVNRLSEFFVSVDKALPADGGADAASGMQIADSGMAAKPLASTGDGVGVMAFSILGLVGLALVLATMAFPAFSHRKMER